MRWGAKNNLSFFEECHRVHQNIYNQETHIQTHTQNRMITSTSAIRQHAAHVWSPNYHLQGAWKKKRGWGRGRHTKSVLFQQEKLTKFLEGRPGMSDVFPLSGISGLSVDSTFPSTLFVILSSPFALSCLLLFRLLAHSPAYFPVHGMARFSQIITQTRSWMLVQLSQKWPVWS